MRFFSFNDEENRASSSNLANLAPDLLYYIIIETIIKNAAAIQQIIIHYTPGCTTKSYIQLKFVLLRSIDSQIHCNVYYTILST